MPKLKPSEEVHLAGPQLIGFDYQFYYFMLIALELRHGQKVGFEVKDDVHIDREDGTTILFQTKHTVLQDKNGKAQNLRKLDVDLWKTLSNWCDSIRENNENYLDTHSFVLVTNKNEKNYGFTNSLAKFKIDRNITTIQNELKQLIIKTKDKNIKNFIENLASLDKEKLSSFLSKISIETGVDEIISKVKNKILERCLEDKFVEPIFEKLSSNFQEEKYTDIKDRKNFEISFDDFKNKFGKCFRIAFKETPLPKRNVSVPLPVDLENQIFIKQLIDIGEVQRGSKYIREYTTQMLKTLNHFSYWVEGNHVLPSEMNDFKDNSVQIWKMQFRSKYRDIEIKISSGNLIDDLENEICSLGIEIVDYLRRQDLSISNYPAIGIEFSNGHYYALSNNLEIGWHFDWENKYK